MSSRPSLRRRTVRRPWLQVWLGLSLVLAMAAAPWWQQALARTVRDVPAMAICSVGNGLPGNAPVHLAGGHCPLCCGSLGVGVASDASQARLAAVTDGTSYPLVRSAGPLRSASLAPGSARARAPPA